MSAEPRTWTDFLFNPLPAYNLAIFRMVFGFFMMWEMGYLISLDFVGIFLEAPQVHFPYDLFTWLKPLPGPAMWLLIMACLLASVAVAIGWYARPAALFLAFGFGYIFLLDKSIYNNHLYLLLLLSFQMYFLESDRVLAVQNKSKADGVTTVPAWMYYLPMIQLVIVYFYGGLAKLNTDWLVDHQPVKQLLLQGSFLTDIIGVENGALFLVWGGLIFDLVIGFLLLWKRTFWLGFAGALFFNIMNSQIFDDINIFPFFMMCSLILFVDKDWIQKLVEAHFPPTIIPKKKTDKKAVEKPDTKRSTVVAWLAVYMAFQLLYPFRHFLYEGNTEWTMEAQRFSWRMKIQYRKNEGLPAFRVLDYQTKTLHKINLISYGLCRDQITLLTHDPAAAWTFAVFLRDYAKKELHSSKVGVQSNIKVGMNGRPLQWMVNPDFDLGNAKRNPFKHNTWIEPLVENPKQDN